ncbi:MAG: hypothetical protein Q9208_000929 [Pyrenodesmia sp. 3 TL-2023]
MASRLSVYLFGDQTFQFKGDLGALLLSGNNPSLNDFLDQAALSLRQEIQSLPWSQRDQFPTFWNFLDLLAIDTSKPLHPGLQLALCTVHHLAVFLIQRKSEIDSAGAPEVSFVSGYGTGTLAAAAASCCTTPEQLLPIALETVLLSFRVGLLAANIRDQVVIDRADQASWRISITADQTELVLQQLEDFCAQKPVYAPFHAAHIFCDNDVERIVDSLSPSLAEASSKLTTLSHLDGKPAPPQSLKSLLTVALKSILRENLASVTTLQGIKATVQSHVAQSCTTLVSIGTPVGSVLAAMMEKDAPGADAVTCIDGGTIIKKISTSRQARQSKIAITGFSGRFPEAENIHRFWDVLHGGIDTHSATPQTRWDVDTHVDPTLKRKNTSGTPWGCWINQPGHFDRSFFSISPREAPQMDPAQRLALMCAYEAVEMAGLVPDATPSTQRSRVGVFIGSTSNDWCETNSAQDVDTYFIPGGNRAFIPGRVNYYFKFSGPSFSIDTACSSSLAATHLACNALWRNDIDTAIVGGTNILTNPDVTAGLDRGHFLSRTGNCKTFDDGADGYCRGEGVGIVILKRLEDAQAENDPIHACILSAVTNHSAEAESITRPHVGAQQALFSQVLAKGGVHPDDVSYVEMHGTGTQAGDGREMTSVSSTFAPWPPGDPRSRVNDLHVGSVKANVGHGESAAGVTAMIKVLLMMQKNEIPPHCGIKTKINQTFPSDLEERRIKIAREATPWSRTSKPRRVLLNNFSAAGGNSCVLIEDGPRPDTESRPSRPDTRPAHVVTLSAKTQKALEANIRSLAQFLETVDVGSLPALAYTTTARRVHYNFRSSYVARTVEDLSQSLNEDAAHPPKQVRGPPRMVFAFSGQGSNHAGMGRYLYNTNTTFKLALDRSDAIIRGLGFDAILPYIQGIEDGVQGASIQTVQLAHVSLQMALARLWESWGIVPTAVVGHSLGEYAALNYAGVLSEFDVLWICGQRVKLLEAHCQTGTHSMLAIRCGQDEATTSLDGIHVEVACINSPRETVVSGANEDIELSAARLDSKGIKYNRINVPYAFHSSQLQPIMDDFTKVLDGLTLKSPKITVLSPLTSTVYKAGDELEPNYLLRQCRESVNLVGAVRAAEAASIFNDKTHVIETGPGLVLARLIQRTMENPQTINPSLDPNQDSWLVLSRSVASAYRVGCNINWAQFHRDYEHTIVQLPSYSWDLKHYWMQYVHDWSLRKGEPLPAIQASPERRLNVSTTCCQKLVSEEFKGDTVHAVMESDLNSPDLKPVVGGHKVNGIAVCVGAVYAEMAVSCAKTILGCFQADTSQTAILVQDMDMQEGLIINESPNPQLVRIVADCVWKERKVSVEISSIGEKGQMLKLHAKATVAFEDRKGKQQELRQSMSNTGSQIQEMKNNAASGTTERFTTSMAYRMVASLAHYDASHKGVKEVYLDSTTLEGCALVSSAMKDRLPGDFAVHPCTFDSILQLATFVMNANENSRFDQEVYVVRGWESEYLDGVLSPEDEYETYVKMTAQNADVSVGDIVIMKNNNWFGCIKRVRVQRVPRRLMDVMFRPKPDVSVMSLPPNPSSTAKKEAKVVPSLSMTPNGSSKTEKALSIIAEESGIPKNELKDEDLLGDVGIDSLLILVIASRFREELPFDLDPSFFVEVYSIGAIKAFFNNEANPPPVDDGLESSGTSSDSESAEVSDASSNSDDSRSTQPDVDLKEQSPGVKPIPRSTSIILQGNLNPTSKTMFMFPDGSGSATSYMHLPRLRGDIALVAMNCPYMTNPKEMQGSFEDIAGALLAEVRRRQPKGPYYLGGWSAGGAFAHYAARILIEAGEEVRSLLLIDAPCPVGLGKLPQLFFDYWRTIHEPGGIVGDRPLPSWLMDHFKAVNESLRGYNATPLPQGQKPKVFLVWAALGTDNLAGFPHRHLLTAAESEDLGFLMDDKSDFSTRGWEKLVESDITIERAMTSNHFTITRGEGAKMVGELIRKACAE